ncbi:hypothetical protein [Corallococcus sp. CA053C]|uniref:hypothetical protein n=1 Tax=Corallococcus sp. CA053C TaxID=2316732 RepID=UPI0011C475E4|nr:hypothetical protein [Corallococcus sp. CA053C]
MMAVSVFAMTAMNAEAEDVKIQSSGVKLAPRVTPAANQAAKSSATGAMEVAVNDGAKGTRLYRFDRGTGTLTLVKQLSQKDAPSSVSRFKDLQVAEREAPASKQDLVIAVAPEGRPPKGGPPGGSDPGLITQADFAALNRALAGLNVEKSKVTVGPVQQAQAQTR